MIKPEIEIIETEIPDTVHIGKCSKCKRDFICGIMSFSCRHCGFHNGDRDLHTTIDNFKEQLQRLGE